MAASSRFRNALAAFIVFWPFASLAQIYPSPHFNSVTTDAGVNASTTALTNAALQALSTVGLTTVTRMGVNATGDASPLTFTASNASCSLNSGAGDVGTQVPSADGKCWLANAPAGGEDVREWGADATGATDSSAAITAAAASGVTLRFAQGQYQFANMNLTGAQVVNCDGPGVITSPTNTILEQNSTSGNFITLSGWKNEIHHCGFTPVVRTTGYQVAFAYSCYACVVDDFFLSHAYSGFLDNANSQATISHGTIGSMLGAFGIEFVGTSSQIANNLTSYDVLANNAYPLGYGTVVAWTTSTSYVSGNITKINGAIYQESAASCTSASSGAGPSGLPSGTDVNSVFSGTIADGSCTWRFVSADLIGLDNDNYARSLYAVNFATLNNLESIRIRNSSGVSAGQPWFVQLIRPTGDHNFWSAIDMEGGFDVEITNPYAGSSLQLNGIQFGGTFVGDGKVRGGHIDDNWENGIFLAAGSQFDIDGVTAASNSQAGSGMFNNISVAAGISDFTIRDPHVGQDLYSSHAYAAYGVLVNTGSSDYYTISGALCSGNVVTACVLDGGTGTHKTVFGNN